VLLGVGVVTFLAGLLFGYDQKVISASVERPRSAVTNRSAPASPRSSSRSSSSRHDRRVYDVLPLRGPLRGLVRFMWIYVPEMEGRTLEEIQAGWKRGAGQADGHGSALQ
jgi:hypothetical protein